MVADTCVAPMTETVRKLRVYQEAPGPAFINGVPVCDDTCKHWSAQGFGSRCALLDLEPNEVCK